VLVAEGVAERLDRVGGPDDVAVAVQPGVDLPQGQDAVAGEDLETGAAEQCAGERDPPCGGWGESGVVVVGWAATTGPRDAGVEGITVEGELVEEVEPLLGHLGHRPVEVLEAADEVLALDVDAEPLAR
jgi:hypothetical protein